jgi:hypothetical protein
MGTAFADAFNFYLLPQLAVLVLGLIGISRRVAVDRQVPSPFGADNRTEPQMPDFAASLESALQDETPRQSRAVRRAGHHTTVATILGIGAGLCGGLAVGIMQAREFEYAGRRSTYQMMVKAWRAMDGYECRDAFLAALSAWEQRIADEANGRQSEK